MPHSHTLCKRPLTCIQKCQKTKRKSITHHNTVKTQGWKERTICIPYSHTNHLESPEGESTWPRDSASWEWETPPCRHMYVSFRCHANKDGICKHIGHLHSPRLDVQDLHIDDQDKALWKCRWIHNEQSYCIRKLNAWYHCRKMSRREIQTCPDLSWASLSANSWCRW